MESWHIPTPKVSNNYKLGQRREQVNTLEDQLDLIRKFDPHALSLLARDRTLYYSFKRMMDLTIAILVLVFMAPVLVAIAVLIVLDSGRPVIFKQERIGARRWKRQGITYWRQTRFTFYKFRTMIRDADPALHRGYTQALINNDSKRMAAMQGGNNQIWKLVSDPRVTRNGKFLRRTSLDELPQLWNVFKGDMSLVGPRPPIPYEVDEYKSWHRRRLETKPGLTGLWQVSARSSVDFDEMVRLDIEYIEHQSLWLDIKILLKTPLAVLLGKGAV